MENLSKRDLKAVEKTGPGWDARIADSPRTLNLGFGLRASSFELRAE